MIESSFLQLLFKFLILQEEEDEEEEESEFVEDFDESDLEDIEDYSLEMEMEGASAKKKVKITE